MYNLSAKIFNFVHEFNKGLEFTRSLNKTETNKIFMDMKFKFRSVSLTVDINKRVSDGLLHFVDETEVKTQIQHNMFINNFEFYNSSLLYPYRTEIPVHIDTKNLLFLMPYSTKKVPDTIKRIEVKLKNNDVKMYAYSASNEIPEGELEIEFKALYKKEKEFKMI